MKLLGSAVRLAWLVGVSARVLRLWTCIYRRVFGSLGMTDLGLRFFSRHLGCKCRRALTGASGSL